MGKKAILLGASGLIGSSLLELLLKSDAISEILIFVRKPLLVKNNKIREIVTDFSDLASLKQYISGDVIFSCLGSTKRKTPNLNNYKRIDHEIPLTFAKYGIENGVKEFHLVSALGANANASNFYSKMKGETEDELKSLPFSTIHIYQPSLLRGKRKESRPLEKLALVLSKIVDPILIGSLKKYRSISADVIASAMLNQSKKEHKGIFSYPSDKIKELV